MEEAWPAAQVTLMLVSPQWADFLRLRRICRSEDWTLYWVNRYRQAAPIIREHAVPVVIGEPEVEGEGRWQPVLELGGWRPHLLVTVSDPDNQTYAEIAEMGAFDGLVKPLDSTSVVRAASLAWASCLAEQESARVHTPQQ
jgi:DNA-binding NtrC family response regulator